MSENYLVHHGIKGQKWGVRRYQNTDGTLTKEGKKRYSEEYGRQVSIALDRYQEKSDAMDQKHASMEQKIIDQFNESWERSGKSYEDDNYIDTFFRMMDNLDTAYEKKMTDDFIQGMKTDPNYIRAKEILKKYGSENLDSFVRDWSEAWNEIYGL